MMSAKALRFCERRTDSSGLERAEGKIAFGDRIPYQHLAVENNPVQLCE